MNGPCKKNGILCPHRRPGCRNVETCQAWAEYRAALEQEAEERKRENIIIDYTGRSIFRHRKAGTKEIIGALSQR